jgi:hypothetical protein
MSVETHVQDALDRAETERAHVEQKGAAFQEFRAAVRETEPTTGGGQSGGPMADGGIAVAATGYAAGGSQNTCEQVREQFAETVGQASDVAGADETTVETLREEFCEEVALALSPHSGSQFTPNMKQIVLTAAANRRQELGALRKALDIERDSLESAAEETTEMTAWLAEADQTPLLSLGFEELRQRHERLSALRDRCERIADQRQNTLETTTSYEGSAGIEHDGVIGYLYDDFPSSHPVLSTTTRLEEVCADCQRSVRDHLTRRV